jgi:predicted  nucleic acid-binding Zn-ribbon protein
MTIREQLVLNNKRIRTIKNEVCTIDSEIDRIEIEILEIERKAKAEISFRKSNLVRLLENKREYFREISQINQKIADLKSQI